MQRSAAAPRVARSTTTNSWSSSAVFTFPYVSIKNALIVDPDMLLVINDNNYPGTGGRIAGVSDPTQFCCWTWPRPCQSPRAVR